MNEQQAQEALGRIDQVISQVNLSRPQHTQLVQDINAIQTIVKMQFQEEDTDGRTDD